MAMPFCQLSFFYNTYSQCTVCTEQNLIYFVLLPGFILFSLTSVHVNPFSIFSPALVIDDFLKTFS